MLDCSRLCSGSAAVLVADGPTCRRITDAPVWIQRALAVYVLGGVRGRRLVPPDTLGRGGRQGRICHGGNDRKHD